MARPHVATGARVWDAEVAVHAAVGPELRPAVAALASRGLDTRALTVTDHPSVQLTLRDRDGARELTLSPASGDHRELDRRRVDWTAVLGAQVDGCHLGPQSAPAQQQELARLADGRAVVTADVLIDPTLPSTVYRDGTALRGVDAFLPSEAEVEALWGRGAAGAQVLADLASVGVRVVVVTRGARGADLVTADGTWRVPTAVSEVVDPTGAGDAFCGGFLAGMVATGDAREAAVRGTVSAALTVEHHGALAALDAIATFDRDGRAAQVRRGVVRR